MKVYLAQAHDNRSRTEIQTICAAATRGRKEINMLDILTALLAVVSVSLLLGILLALVIRFFAEEDDERLIRIRDALPGINCGACGYKGCDDYASVLTAGGTRPNLCIPGGRDTAEALEAILGVDAEAPRDVVAFVHCDGVCGATVKKAVYEGVDTCKAASMVYGGPDACSYSCLGFGDCAAACPANTICINEGVAIVDTRGCIGCGVCARTCPRKIISMIPREASTAVRCSSKDKGIDARKACKNACIACKKCEKICPHGAIKVIDNCAVIDYEKCTGCLECVSVCPTGCLKSVSFRKIDA